MLRRAGDRDRVRRLIGPTDSTTDHAARPDRCDGSRRCGWRWRSNAAESGYDDAVRLVPTPGSVRIGGRADTEFGVRRCPPARDQMEERSPRSRVRWGLRATADAVRRTGGSDRPRSSRRRHRCRRHRRRRAARRVPRRRTEQQHDPVGGDPDRDPGARFAAGGAAPRRGLRRSHRSRSCRRVGRLDRGLRHRRG